MFLTRKKKSYGVHYITVTRAGVVKYKNSTIIVEQNGLIQYRFRNTRVLQVYNRIEGHLKFYGLSSPPGRTFPGYGELTLVLMTVYMLVYALIYIIPSGFLRIRNRIAQFFQTIADPMVCRMDVCIYVVRLCT